MDHAAHEPFNYVTSSVLIFFGTQLPEQMMHCCLSHYLIALQQHTIYLFFMPLGTVADFKDNCSQSIENFLSISFDFIHRLHNNNNNNKKQRLFILLPWGILSEEMLNTNMKQYKVASHLVALMNLISPVDILQKKTKKQTACISVLCFMTSVKLPLPTHGIKEK